MLRGNHTESHTFLPGRFVFGSLPGQFISPQLATTELNPLQSASFGLPQFYQQGFGDPDYPAYTRPLTGLFVQDSWRIKPNFTLNYGLRYEIDSQYNPLNTFYKDFAPRISFAWDPFNDHKTVVRGGYGIFYGNIDAQIPQVDLSLGVLNRNRSTVENQRNKQQVPDQVNNLVNTCGVGFPGIPIIPGTGASPCNRFISIYADSLLPTPLPIVTADVIFQTLFANGLIQCTTPLPGQNACVTPQSLGPTSAGGLFPGPLGSGIIPTNSGPISPATVTFSNPPNYQPRTPNRLRLLLSGRLRRGFRSPQASSIPTRCICRWRSIRTCCRRRREHSALANGKLSRTGTGIPARPRTRSAALKVCRANQIHCPCFVSPLVVQNNQYTAASSAFV